METKLKSRLNELTTAFKDPKNVLNVDSLLDCVSALIYETGSKASKENKSVETYVNRFTDACSFIESKRVNLNDFDVVRVLGRGAFGEVSLVRHIETNHVFAMKQLIKSEMIKRGEAACIWEEREIMALSNSEWLVQMYYSFQNKTSLYMVMEYMQGGDMVNMMSTYEIPEAWAKFYIAELSLALEAIHSLGFIHRDVKPDNMLLDNGGHLKLCDFGTCLRVDKNGKVLCSIAVGTPDYISPEVLTSQNSATTYGKECDWWSVGIFLYEMLIGDTPFYAESLVGTYSKIMSYKTSLKFPSDHSLSEPTIDLIKKFLTDPATRLGKNGISEIMKHPFFDQKDWKWTNIRQCTPPVVPEIAGDDDATNFDELSDRVCINNDDSPERPFAGNHIPFIGFSYSREYDFGATISGGTSIAQTSGSSNIEKKFSELQQSYELAIKKQESLEEQKKKVFQELEEINTNYKNEVKMKGFLEEKVQDLQKKYEEKKNEIEEIRTTTKVLADRNSELEGQIQTFSQKISAHDDLSENAQRSANKLKVFERELSEMSVKLKNSETKLSELQKSEKSNKKKTKKLKEQLEETSRNVEKLVNEKRSLESKLVESSTNLNMEAERIASLNVELKSFQAKYDSVIKEFDGYKSNYSIEMVTDLNYKLSHAEAQIKTLDSSLRLTKSQLSTQENNNRSSIESRIVELENNLNESIKEIDQLRSKLSEADRTISSLRAELDQTKKHLDSSLIDAKVHNESFTNLSKKHMQSMVKEAQLKNEKDELLSNKNALVEQIAKLNTIQSNYQTEISELKEQVESEKNFSSLYKSQIDGMIEEISDYSRQFFEYQSKISSLSEANDNLYKTIQNAKQESDSIRNSKFELEHSISQMKNQNEILEQKVSELTIKMSVSVDEYESKLKTIESERSYLENSFSLRNTDYDAILKDFDQQKDEIESLRICLKSLEESSKKAIETERMLKMEAVKKLSEVLNTRRAVVAPSKSDKKMDKKFEKLNKQLQQELQQERERNNKLISDYEHKISDFKNNVADLQNSIANLQKDIAFKDQKIYSLMFKSVDNSDDLSIDAVSQRNYDEQSVGSKLLNGFHKEGNLSLSTKKGGRKIVWLKHFAVLTNNALFLFKDQAAKDLENASFTIFVDMMFYARPISQNDLIHATSKDIPKIFQIIFSDPIPSEDSTSHKEDSKISEKFTVIQNHNFIPMQYHIPTSCDVCSKGLWGVWRSSQALECKNCHYKCHKEHATENSITPCKAYDQKWVAKEMMLMASSQKDQISWIDVLTKLIPKTTSSNIKDQRSSFKSVLPEEHLVKSRSSFFSRKKNKSFNRIRFENSTPAYSSNGDPQLAIKNRPTRSHTLDSDESSSGILNQQLNDKCERTQVSQSEKSSQPSTSKVGAKSSFYMSPINDEE